MITRRVWALLSPGKFYNFVIPNYHRMNLNVGLTEWSKAFQRLYQAMTQLTWPVGMMKIKTEWYSRLRYNKIIQTVIANHISILNMSYNLWKAGTSDHNEIDHLRPSNPYSVPTVPIEVDFPWIKHIMIFYSILLSYPSQFMTTLWLAQVFP